MRFEGGKDLPRLLDPRDFLLAVSGRVRDDHVGVRAYTYYYYYQWHDDERYR